MEIKLLNNPILREKCVPVEQWQLSEIISYKEEMMKLMEQADGIALAANQVGLNMRFFLMRDGRLVINPEILEIGPLTKYEEGCLSIPGTWAETQRAQHIKVRYKDESFNDVEAEYNGQEAVAFQHEIDHLDGKLYIDQLNVFKRELVLKKHREFKKARSKFK